MDNVLQKIANLTGWDSCVIYAQDKQGNILRLGYGVEFDQSVDFLSQLLVKELYARKPDEH